MKISFYLTQRSVPGGFYNQNTAYSAFMTIFWIISDYLFPDGQMPEMSVRMGSQRVTDDSSSFFQQKPAQLG